MLDKKSDISAQIGSRICHDLISPIGAISNGMELLELSGMAQSPEMLLITDSVRAANAKIRFLRVAFGDASGGGVVGSSEILDILTHNFAEGRLSIEWHTTDPLSRQDLKTCFLALMCLESTLPYGGVITVQNMPEGWQFNATGRDIKVDNIIDLESARFCTQAGPTGVHSILLHSILADSGYTLEFKLYDQGLATTIKT